MSIISSVHQFVKLDKESKPFGGQRLVRLIAKKDSKGNYASENLVESLCVSVPRVTSEQVADVIDRLIPHVIGLVQDAQDKIIREFRIEHGRNEIPEEEFGIERVISYLDESAAGDRVTREYLEQWFDEEYSDIARQYVEQAMTGVTETVRDQKVAILRGMIADWFSPKASPIIPKLRATIKFIDCCVENQVCEGRMSAIGVRATRMLATKEAELASDALGF